MYWKVLFFMRLFELRIFPLRLRTLFHWWDRWDPHADLKPEVGTAVPQFWDGLGWSVMTFVELRRMVDATQLMGWGVMILFEHSRSLKTYIPKEVHNKNKIGGINETMRHYMRRFVWRHKTAQVSHYFLCCVFLWFAISLSLSLLGRCGAICNA